METLSQSAHSYGIILHSFVLMNNHWHFLAQTPLGSLGEFIHHFNITYTSHFNRRHKRVSHLYQSILGSESFVSWVRDSFLVGAADREKPVVVKFHQYLSMEAVVIVVEKAAGNECPLQSTRTSRQIVMTALYQCAGLNNREIGDLLGVDYSTVSQGRKRLRDKAEKDIKIKVILARITKACKW